MLRAPFKVVEREKRYFLPHFAMPKDTTPGIVIAFQKLLNPILNTVVTRHAPTRRRIATRLKGKLGPHVDPARLASFSVPSAALRDPQAVTETQVRTWR